MKTFFNSRPIHLVKAWTANEADETPVCGADKNLSSVWGFRTVFKEFVSCEDCKREMED